MFYANNFIDRCTLHLHSIVYILHLNIADYLRFFTQVNSLPPSLSPLRVHNKLFKQRFVKCVCAAVFEKFVNLFTVPVALCMHKRSFENVDNQLSLVWGQV